MLTEVRHVVRRLGKTPVFTLSEGAISFHIASLYPTLYRLEDKGLVEGRWVERAGQRRRRYYRLTAEGRKVLAKQRSIWDRFFNALNRVASIRHA